MEIGKVTHFFGKISVVVIELSSGLKVGDTIRFSGHDVDFEQHVDSMQIDHKPVEEAHKGQSIGLKTVKEVKVGCSVEIVK